MERTNEKKILSKITEIYIIAILILFPLCVDSTGFFRILECKYRCFLVINSIYISAIIIALSYYKLFKKVKFFEGFKLHSIQWAVIVFWGVNLISTLLSPLRNDYNLLIGVGRGEGLINITLYCLSFLNITLFGEFKKRYILYFSISSIFISLISILQYIGFNPFNMYQAGIGTHNVSFIGTIGNVDFVSALYCILLTVSMAAYVFLDENKKIEKIMHLLSVYMGFFIFEVLDVLSGTVAFGATLILAIPFIITNSKRLSKLLIIAVMILLGYITNLIINPVYYYELGKLNLDFQINYITIILTIIVGVFAGLAYLLKNRNFDISNNKRLIKLFYILLIVCIISALISIYFIDFKDGFLYEIHQILHGNLDDDFGTYRLFLWKRSISLIKDYPIIGTGPDTFAVRFMDKYTQDVAQLGEITINDTAANNYLTILVNIGIIGLATYLTFLILQSIYAIKKGNKYSIVLFTAFICFIIQDFFNLWVVITIPVFWLLMSLIFTSINNKCTNETEEKNEK